MLGHALLADPLAHPFHLLGRHAGLGQLQQVSAAVLERRSVRAGPFAQKLKIKPHFSV
jgi:hypothetical protein